MGKYFTEQEIIIMLAYFHRYGWIATMLGGMYMWPQYFFYIMGGSMLLFSIWSLVGYKCKWRHIYCSYQNAYHKEMTPYFIQWSQIKKSDAYIIPFIFFVMGFIMLFVAIMYTVLANYNL